MMRMTLMTLVMTKTEEYEEKGSPLEITLKVDCELLVYQ